MQLVADLETRATPPGHTSPSPKLPIRPQIEVFTEVFTGPLELLLALVEREEIDLFEVQLTAIAQEYLVRLSELPAPPPEEIAEFLWLAARLLLLKSIRLLPGEQPEPEETELLGWEESVRKQLQEYQLCQKLAKELMARREREVESYPAPVREIEVAGQEEPLQVDSLLVAFQGLLQRLPPRPVHYIGRVWKIEEKLSVLEVRLRQGRFDLVTLILESADRLEAVVTFVALLDLLRRRRAKVSQPTLFGEIWVEAV